MKNIIIIFSLLVFQSCKPQAKDELKKTVTESVKINSDTVKLTNVDLKISEQIINNMVIKYKENLIIPKEELEKLPIQVREKFITFLDSPIYYVLKNNEKESTYSMITNNKIESSTEDTVAKTKNKTTVQLPEQNVYKNFDELIYVKQENLLDKKYLITEKLSTINWRLYNEIKKIDKFNCKKATAIINNKQVTAWYCEEIASNDGPSIYYGLPGLILQLEAEDRLYSAIEIKFEKELIIKKDNDGTVISGKNYDLLLKKAMENPIITNETNE
ncbi:GLPGLI family protein [Lutibacter sp.]|uniref:GLPGLI family protein n=1 Tax=Lutibacter sp. TaxID=1925666 RepID=UPI003566653E